MRQIVLEGIALKAAMTMPALLLQKTTSALQSKGSPYLSRETANRLDRRRPSRFTTRGPLVACKIITREWRRVCLGQCLPLALFAIDLFLSQLLV